MRTRPIHHRHANGERRILLAVVLLAAVVGCSPEPAFRRQAEEEGLVDAIRATLLSSVEAEKSAVLATTDEESLQMAQESRRLAERIDALVGDLRTHIDADGRPATSERFAAFVARWEELKAVDQRLLALAVANTNLKAMRLSAREGLSAVDRLLVALDAMERSSTDPDTIRTLAAASVAALREQSLLLIHIPSADDAEMTSDKIPLLGFDPSGTVRGKEALRAYWRKGLDLLPNLHFTLIDVYVSPDSVVVFYENERGAKICEYLRLNAGGKIRQGSANHPVH